ncbi:radical SAM family heme chaperone HemW [Plebeiibacterium sediminum]|uniref:Heme chaperone HemW n=1 Tax=Plebeiibacterium sediminum TaxID=2992112 RepID=A0AAE3M1F9_9BACT|nr:radical SAM family heme chaperone HemW [Plebeiobacterium sediminum]MCW3785166.1 radical SAM family heme chaperone HemW [Plebeiobacterium sediminum]
MAGIYLHIPFCIRKCGYCDFYSITDLSLKDKFVDSLISEISSRKSEFNEEQISTIYFGGGTPSLLTKQNLISILDTIYQYIPKKSVNELTIEVNPDDITPEFLEELIEIGFNRISIGTQSFNDDILKMMNRRHDAKQAMKTVQLAQKKGFKNISIDLIYGVPDMSLTDWESSLNIAVSMNVQHISAYHLTFEKGTPFYSKLKKGELKEISDSDSVDQYQKLLEILNRSGFNDYEISNFAQNGCESQHNSGYWSGKNYFGFGPGAHSYKNNIRRWNISNLLKYIKNVGSYKSYFSNETLSEEDRFNELIMLGLRTRKGVDMNFLNDNFNSEIWNFFKKEYEIQKIKSNVFIDNGFLKVCENKRFITDQIISDFFKI